VDGRKFDELARRLGERISRRGALKAAAGSAIGAAGAVAIASHGASPGKAQEASPVAAAAPGGQKLPNILLLMGDDIGWFNLSAYNMGMMGYQTPNIDRIAREGMIFTDNYGEQSCTAGRAAFITGQSPFRTGLLTIGMPGDDQGIQEGDPTLADLLKPLGYATGQFGKNHLGDLNKFLPTVHGFDEFFGNLYHLNAEEEPENPDYPKDPNFIAEYGPRGVLKSWATDVDDETVEDRWGKVGKQVIENTGPLDTKRMETIDEEFLASTLDFIDRKNAEGTPWLCWFNSTRMHIRTHLKPESDGVTGLGVEADGLVEHDGHIGQILAKLDELGIAENTLVIYTTDNGAEIFDWPDGGMTPFRGEKNSTWEGAFRVPLMVRWPGKIQAGSVCNQLFSHLDWVPTIMSIVGVRNIADKLKKGYEAGDKTFKVHRDGYEQKELLFEGGPTNRDEFFYFTSDGELASLRMGRWKIITKQMNAEGVDTWIEPFDDLRAPRIIDLRGDPFERAPETSAVYGDWWLSHLYLLIPAQDEMKAFYQTLIEFPPEQGEGKIGKLVELINRIKAASDKH